MNYEKLIGQAFQENELYELIVFDIEENFEQYFSKFIHIYFERTDNQKIKITEVIYFNDTWVMDKKSRSLIEKKEWFEISENENHFNLLLCRFDRSGSVSSIWKDSTHTQD